jgi:hypothetical protein
MYTGTATVESCATHGSTVHPTNCAVRANEGNFHNSRIALCRLPAEFLVNNTTDKNFQTALRISSDLDHKCTTEKQTPRKTKKKLQ